MSEEYTHDCSTCSASCSSRAKPEDFRVAPNSGAHIKKVVAVMSGKGGVGKSIVTSLLAVAMRRAGFRVGILDADITGPSIPRMFGLYGCPPVHEEGIEPARSANDIAVISLNLFAENDTDPVIWRGPVIASAVTQFWTDVAWGDIDYLFVDLPPGTGDVPLTVFQSLPIDGIVVVTSPQDLVSMIVAKAVNMATMMNVPVLGVVENFNGFKCPDCGSVHEIFGESHVAETAGEWGLALLGSLPIDPALARAADSGLLEETAETQSLAPAVTELKKLLEA